MYNKEKPQNSLITSIIAAVIFILILGVFGRSQAAGLLKPVNGSDSLISIKSHDVKVVINNGFAKTQVDQVFVNNGDAELETLANAQGGFEMDSSNGGQRRLRITV